MNYGKFGVDQKLDRLDSSSGKISNRAGLYTLRFVLFLIAALIVTAVCLLYGAYRGVIDCAPDIADVNIMPNGYVTFLYDDDEQELQKLNSAEGNRISVSINDIPENMQHAIVAVEDSRFYDHNGVDNKGMLRALAVAVSSGFSRTEGASTITQQLLKNNVFTNWMTESRMQSIRRKIQEQYLAVKLEAYLWEEGENAKDVILENYLNTVNFGAGAYGIQTASQTYFGKDCSELTLSECAVLAAIPQNPSKWNPRSYPENNRERQLVVLKDMLDQGYISQTEYQDAVNDDPYSRIQETSDKQETEPYSYFVDEVISQVKTDLMEQLGYTEVQAENAIYSGGLKIYTTQDSSIQNIMEEEFQNPDNYPANVQVGLDWALTVEHEDGEWENYSREMLQLYFRQNIDSDFDLLFDTQEEAQSAIDQYKAAILSPNDTIIAERSSFSPQPQAAMTIIDQSTGYVKGIVGGLGEKTASLTMNRATDSERQPGSTFKILSTYGPALDLGKITLATTVEDSEYNYTDGSPVHNSDNSYHGNVTIRQAITNSYNVVAVKTLTEITPQVGFDYLMDLGFTTLINDKNYDVRQPLALGGVTNGVTNLELCAAYAAIANKGVYTEPKFYSRVEDHNGNVLLENTGKQTKVFKTSTAYMLTSAMEDVVTQGTGTDFTLDNNIHLAGKTGTTTSYHDLVFAGFTPYYTAAIWAGYDVNVELPEEMRNYHKTLWTNIMNRVHQLHHYKGKIDADFAKPSTVKEATVCSESGYLASNGCPAITEYFVASKVPTTYCSQHSAPSIEVTPTPTAAPTPTLTISPEATETPAEEEPTQEPDPTQEPEETEEPVVTEEPEPEEPSGDENPDIIAE